MKDILQILFYKRNHYGWRHMSVVDVRQATSLVAYNGHTSSLVAMKTHGTHVFNNGRWQRSFSTGPNIYSELIILIERFLALIFNP